MLLNLSFGSKKLMIGIKAKWSNKTDIFQDKKKKKYIS